MEDGGTTGIALDKVCQPKNIGGMAVLNLAKHNKCLLMKYLDKFFNKADIP